MNVFTSVNGNIEMLLTLHSFLQHQERIANTCLKYRIPILVANLHIKDFRRIRTHFDKKVFSKTCNESTGGSDTPVKYVTENLLQTENGTNEEQHHTHVNYMHLNN